MLLSEQTQDSNPRHEILRSCPDLKYTKVRIMLKSGKNWTSLLNDALEEEAV